MTTLTVWQSDRHIYGFELSGHAMTACYGSDILCAAISSAAYMAVNTVTDVACAKAETKACDGYMNLRIFSPDEYTDIIMRGFVLHIEGLKEQYPKHIKTVIKEGVF